MEQEPDNSQNQEKRRSLSDLLLWLALLPVILGTLLCCGQLSLAIRPGTSSANTGSLLKADYGGWAYESIPAIDIERFIRDIEKDRRLYETGGPEGEVIEGVYWEPPTPVVQIGQITPTAPVLATPTPTLALRTPTKTNTPTSVQPVVTVTRGPTATALSTVTRTSTATFPPPPPPTRTFTDEPEEEDTPTRTPTQAGTITFTPTATNEPTLTEEPTLTPTPTPTYAPVRPFAENNGVSDPVPGGGCRAFFGYRNDNPQEVDIPYSLERNWIDDPVAQANPPQPSHFLIGRIFSVFEFTWYTGTDLTWWLDGRPAVVLWCNPAPP